MTGKGRPLSADVGVDVIIPVYGAADELHECLRSVERHTPTEPHRVTLVIDGPQNDAVEEVLRAAMESHFPFVVTRLARRCGFVAAVNHGMGLSTRDVVLLNSDTVVTARWVEKLAAAAGSDPAVATVTPFSNNATICSVPEFLECNLLPSGLGADRFAEVVEAAALPEYPPLPTGVGVCMFIRRRALLSLGQFDGSFGLGYGEETDFCRRAVAAGWKNILDDTTFIFHHGRRSFGGLGNRRERAANRIIKRRYPDYFPELVRFIAEDPLEKARARIATAIAPRPSVAGTGLPKVVHLVHGWPPFNHAGTEVYARNLALEQARRAPVAAYARIADSGRPSGERVALSDHGVRVRLVVNNFDRRNPLARNALVDRKLERDFASFLDEVAPDIVHVHHLSGLAASLIHVAAARGARIVYQVQDWWAMCARANLVRADSSSCPGPSATRCGRCLPLTGFPPKTPINIALHLLRSRMLSRCLARAHAYVMGSECIKGWYERAGLFAPGVPVHVLPYGVAGGLARDRPPSPSRPGRPIRFGFIGSIMPHKGAHVAVRAMQGIRPEQATLEIWGNPAIDAGYAAELTCEADPEVVRLRGGFDDRDKRSILEDMQVLLVPSIGLESFGIAAREAMAAGIPVIASAIGALNELEIDGRCGALVPAGDASALRGEIDRVLAAPELLDHWRQRLPAVKSARAHSDEIGRVYEEVLAQ